MDTEDVPVSAVGVKIPPFWEEDPEAWFGQAEAQFHLRKVKDSTTKFYHIISMLPHKVAVSVKDLTRKPPASEPYETLKFRLLQAYSMTESQKAAALIRHPPLGDRRPSQLLDTMLALLPDDHQPCFFFKYLFMEKLPKDLRGQLASRLMITVFLDLKPTSYTICCIQMGFLLIQQQLLTLRLKKLLLFLASHLNDTDLRIGRRRVYEPALVVIQKAGEHSHPPLKMVFVTIMRTLAVKLGSVKDPVHSTRETP